MALQNVEANITLDLYNHDTTPATVKAIQLDSETRYVAAKLQNVGVQYDVDSGATVQLIVIRPDKVGVQITGTTFTYGDESSEYLGPYAELTQVALAVSGKMRGQFKITSGTQILRTEIFAISNGEALDASTDEWADEYDGYNLEEMATSIETNTADIATLEADVSQIKEGLQDIDERVGALEEGGTGSGLTEAVKVALLQIAQKVAYVDAHGQDYYDDLYDALYPPATLVRIDAVYTQSGTVLTTDTLDSLKVDLVVTATYTDQTTETVTDYTLSGTLSEGTSTITVSYGGKTDTFTVTVTYSPIPSGYTELEYVHANGAYLNTGYIPNANTALEYKFAITELKASGHIISGTNYYGYGVRKDGTSDVGYLLNRFGTEKSARLTSYALGTPIEVGMYMDGDNVVVDNDVVTTCEAGATAAGALSIFTFNGNGNYISVGNLYYIRIYENTTLVREYIPCQRNSDDAIGLYETVNDAFYTSSSRTNFTGPT